MLKGYGHVRLKEETMSGKSAMGKEVHGRRKIGKPRRRVLCRVRGDIKEKGLFGDEVFGSATRIRASSNIDRT